MVIGLEHDNETNTLLLDFSKDFDKLPQKSLHYKLLIVAIIMIFLNFVNWTVTSVEFYLVYHRVQSLLRSSIFAM